MRARSHARPGSWPANRLREARAARGLSQVALGARVGLHGSAVHRLETCQRELTWTMAESLAAVLGERPGDLFVPTRSPPPFSGLAERLATLPAEEREACVRLARRLAAKAGEGLDNFD